MTSRKWSLLLVVSAIAACTETLPSASDEPIFVTLTSHAPSEILVGEVGVLEVEAHDEAGNRLDNPPLNWDLLEGGVQVLDPSSGAKDRLELRGTGTGTVAVEVRLADRNGLFQSDPARIETFVRYGPIRVAFEGVGPDTLLTVQSPYLSLEFSATDHNGLPPQEGGFSVEVRSGSTVEHRTTRTDRMDISFEGSGVDTLFLSHSACWEPCADTLVVTVDPVPVGFGFPDWYQGFRALWDTASLAAHLVDANGDPMEGSPPVWRHVNPEDSTILRILEPVGGRMVSVGNGSALLEIEIDGFTGETLIEVKQVFGPDYSFPQGVGYLVLGQRDTVFTEGTDHRGHPFEIGADPGSNWQVGGVYTQVYDALELIETFDHLGAVVEGVALGPDLIGLWARQCRIMNIPLHILDCDTRFFSRTYTVIPEPDSVRILPPSMDPMTALGTSDEQLLGRIFNATEILPPSVLKWTALDPQIATVDAEGFVTAVSNGTARFEGRMGLAADTTVVSVSAPGG